MPLVRAEIAYNASEAIKKLDREKYLELRARVWGLKLPDWPEGKNEPPSWYSYGETKLGQGRDAVKQLLSDNPELADELEVKIKAEVTGDKLEEK